MTKRCCFLTPYILALLCTLCPGASPANAARLEERMEEAWQNNALLLPNDALRILRSAELAGSREAELARAITLLNAQPRTQGNVVQARDLLQVLIVKQDPEDLVVLQSFYFLGRIHEWYLAEPERARAQDWYRQAMDYWPGHLIGQKAALKWIVQDLFHGPGTMEDRLQRAEAFSSFFSIPELARNYHLVMSNAWTFLLVRGERVLHHSVAALNAGMKREPTRQTMLLRAAEWSRELGDHLTAIEYYQRFLSEFPQNNRSFTIRQMIAELEVQP